MEKMKDWRTRLLVFLPFVLPLIFLRKAPIVHFAQPRWVLVAILYIYAMPPIFDLIGGNNRTNYHPGYQSWTTKAAEYVWLPRILLFKILAIKLLMFGLVSTGRFDIIDCLGIAFLTGQSISSYGIFIAHEVLHRKSKFDRALAEIMMVTVLYPHFCIEHIYGHHRHAATDKDPATSRFGETVYAFLPRSIFGGILHAWRFEVGRLERRGQQWFSLQNRMLRYGAEVFLLLVVVFCVFGEFGLLAVLVQGVVAVTTLEVINYVQHYGLMRKEIAPGVYENTGISHSWNSTCWFSNGYWLNLGRHSDHHYAASRSFQMLRTFEEEPELPAGFPAMFLLAFVPPLWFRVMNPRVEALKGARHAELGYAEVQTPSPAARELESRDGSGAPVVAGWLNVSGWSGAIQGGGLLMGASILAFFGVDFWLGYPYGLMTISLICLGLVAARSVLTHRPFSEARSEPGI
jgi:alkane 1-monooxygenase